MKHCHYLQTHHKKVSDPHKVGCEPPHGCWELNSGPLEEQPVLLTAKPSLPPQPFSFYQAFLAITALAVRDRGKNGLKRSQETNEFGEGFL